MIVVKIYGGLAGQMMQYAIGRALALKNNTKLYLDIEWFKLDHHAMAITPRNFGLLNFRVKFSIYGNNIIARIYRKLFYNRKLKIIKEDSFNSFKADIIGAGNNVYLDGYWVSYHYFSDIIAVLRKEFTPKTIDQLNAEVMKDITGQEQAVSIHVRRGDYITNPSANSFHGVLGADYYKNAVEYIRSLFGNTKFYIFSNDVDWVKENFNYIDNMQIIDFNGDARNYMDIYLMSKCKHNIVANSGFSWWAAYLNSNPDKIVIAPSKWVVDENIKMEDYIPKEWKRI